MKILARQVTFILDQHPNADTLSLAKIQGMGWQCVVRTSDWVGSPHQSVVDGELEYLLEEGYPPVYKGIYIHLDALLDPAVPEFAFLKATKKFPDGRPGHRVKTVRLRGQISQGLVISAPKGLLDCLADTSVNAKTVLAEVYKDNPFAQEILLAETKVDLESLLICHALHIERYEPPVPVDMRGEMVRSPGSFVHYTDIENSKNHPSWFTEGEAIRLTEKIHGTNFRVGMVFDGKDTPEYIVGSHTTAKKPDGTTLYALMGQKYFPEAKVREVFQNDNGKWPFTEHFIIHGEIYGSKVQDLTYGCANGERKVRIFDVEIDHVFQPWDVIQKIAELFGVETVPVLYRGPFNAQVVMGLRDGKTTVPGGTHVREGVVVTSEPEARVVDDDGSTYRKILKYVSDEYLCRAGEKDGH